MINLLVKRRKQKRKTNKLKTNSKESTSKGPVVGISVGFTQIGNCSKPSLRDGPLSVCTSKEAPGHSTMV